MIKTIKITKKFENQTKTDPPKTWWSVYAGSEKYSIWDAKVAAALQEGVEASVDYYTKNGYHTISSIIMAGDAPVVEELTQESLESMFPTTPVVAPKLVVAKPEIPAVAQAINERISAYAAAVQLVTAGNGEYKDIDRIADSALAYYYKMDKLSPPSQPEPDMSEFLRKQ